MDFKNFINRYPKVNIESIKRQIDRYGIISFDIFDTLIKRDVQKEYEVFDLTEKLFNNCNDNKIRGYRAVRKKAEKKARLCSDDEEITIAQIQEALVGEIDDIGVYITESIAESLISFEREVEKQICTRNELIYPAYDYCLKTKKRIIITSDMYWEKEFLEEILVSNGIKNYDSLYVSSEYGKQKKTGSLYQLVVNRENVSAGSILHIGDNKIGDFFSARKAGLKAITIPKDVDNTKYARRVEGSSIEWNCCEKYLSNRLLKIPDPNKRIGYEVYGPLLYSYVRWLSERLDSNKTTLFFARDCYVVKPSYELFTCNNSTNNVYFLGSRRSLIIPALWNGADLEKVSLLIKSEARKLTISGLLNKLGVDSQNYIDTLAEYDLNESTIVDRDHLLDNRKFKSFYNAIKADIEENAKEEYSGFKAYWNTLNCTREIQVVDIGWRGTMQYCLEYLLGEAYTIKGYYLGIRRDAFIRDYEDIYLNGSEDFEKECFLAGMTALIEVFFSAPHGSVKRYRTGGHIVYYPYECEDDELNEQLVKALHCGAEQFVKNYSESLLSQIAPISPHQMFRTLYEMGTRPKKDDLISFGNYPFQMGTGVAKTIDANGLFSYISNPRKFLLDFSNSNWKVGFLRECIGVDISCYPLFKWIYRHRG